jgi:hypothetical protein
MNTFDKWLLSVVVVGAVMVLVLVGSLIFAINGWAGLAVYVTLPFITWGVKHFYFDRRY